MNSNKKAIYLKNQVLKTLQETLKSPEKEELLENLMIEYQKIVYDMLEDRIEAIYTNEEVIDEIYRQRYIRYQNVLKDKYIYQISDLYQKMDKLKQSPFTFLYQKLQ